MTICTVVRAASALLAATVLTAEAAVPTRLDMPLVRQVTHDPSSNHAISPFLITNVLTQVWLGARGTTRKEIGRATGVSGIRQLSGYPAANRALSRTSSVTTAIFNRLYVRHTFSVKPSFTSILRRIYGVDVQKFSSVSQAVTAINTDVERVTRNRIRNLVDDGVLQNAELVLVSALYFKGSWKQKFESIPPRSFLTAAGNKNVPMMQLRRYLQYKTFRDFDAVSLPYDNDDYSLLIIRPLQRSQSAVQALHSRLSSLDIGSIYGRLRGRSQEVIVTMPKFTIESEYDLKPTLVNLGITKLFIPAADLSGISSTRLMVSKIIHKVFMEVNEEGTEAAGAVAVIFKRTAAIEPVSFTVDRPFLAVLYHNKQNLNLFSAWVASP